MDNKYFLPISVILAGLFIGGAVIWNGAHPVTPGSGTTTGGFGNEASIEKLTKTVRGIDTAKVAAAVRANGNTYKAAVDANRAEAQAFGVNATPSFVIGTAMIAGAVPYANFVQALEGKPNLNSKVNSKDVKTSGEPFIGNVNAPITIAFWSDFQCPFCKSFELQTLPQIIQNYVDTGKAKVVFKDFAFLGPDSDTAAIYSRAVWELYPGQYMAWRTAMYQAQDGENDSGSK